ncbi:MAG: phosphonate ABC transporter ATP-binding protein [Candidatus Schekmanbacteria bacterium]|nr:phosphonate ABC transporter ATP-binding protein [Candidatus Schekmanbacteria bacterium]
MTSETLFSLRAVNKVYDGGVHALKDISFEVHKGEFLVVIGLSGSGKSTLLRCMNALHRPTSGEICYRGRDIAAATSREAREIRQRVAMIFQHFNLVPRTTVLKNVLTGALGRTGTARSLVGMFADEERKRAMRFLDLLGIADKARHRADQLSGGQQQRVAIARALTQEPEVLLADEPVASLDPATCHTIMDYLQKVNRELGITIVCNLHFLSLVRQYASRVVALRAGELVFDGQPADIDEAWFRRIYGEEAKEVHVN